MTPQGPVSGSSPRPARGAETKPKKIEWEKGIDQAVPGPDRRRRETLDVTTRLLLALMEQDPKPALRKAFGYLRVSGESQVRGDGFPRQKTAIRKWADQNSVKIVRWFEEKGVSGSVLDRPALSDMMVALMSNGVHLVIVEKLDRIARDQMVQETIIQSLLKNGFELVSASPGEENLCGNDPGRKLMRTIMGAIAEYDKQMLVLKLRAAKQRKRTQPGWSEGRKPFGFRDGEHAVVARMKSLKAEGRNWEGISSTLNAEGFKTRSGGGWFPATVRRIVLAQ